MCNASDHDVEVVLVQCFDTNPCVIYYGSHTLNDAQLNYTMTWKEFFVVIFGFESFDFT